MGVIGMTMGWGQTQLIGNTYDRYTWTSSEVRTQNLSGGDGLTVAKAAEGADRCGAQSPKVIELGKHEFDWEGWCKAVGNPDDGESTLGVVQAR